MCDKTTGNNDHKELNERKKKKKTNLLNKTKKRKIKNGEKERKKEKKTAFVKENKQSNRRRRTPIDRRKNCKDDFLFENEKKELIGQWSHRVVRFR